MPEICRFYGIVIYLYLIPAKVVSKVNQWIDIHQDEILKLWEKASKGEKIEKLLQGHITIVPFLSRESLSLHRR